MANSQDVRVERDFVLYWMIAARRPSSNFAIDRAIKWARELGQPLVIFEPLRVDYPWASERLHRFIIDGMADNAKTLEKTPAFYYPYVEPTPGAGRGLLAALASSASIVITDDFPCFFLPRMVEAAARQIDVRMEAVDSNGLLPMALADRAYSAASHFRRYMQKSLAVQLQAVPTERPFFRLRLPRLTELPRAVSRQWPRAGDDLLIGDSRALARLPIDHAVKPVSTKGGPASGRRALQAFVKERLDSYHETHNHPDSDGTSRLSPYVHFGHVSAHEVFRAVMRHERWSLRSLAPRATGAREGWWGVAKGPEAFLDQLVVWRELAYNTCVKRPGNYDRYSSLPLWARDTLKAHVTDPRPHRYTKSVFERAATEDPLWNAAQRQLLEEGWMHNYMRMLWGKKILEWSRTPQEALRIMMAIMDRWSLDGRDPNSYAGYFWVLGRYDRPWPERPVYGKVRSMSSERTAEKVRVERYRTRAGSASK
jgi:deoxyribodipyrimidine photo-lyase